MGAQIDIELIIDNFAGGGGASTGIELAVGRPVDIAINHDPDAILMHKTNHPYTKHLQASVWDIDPAEVCEGRPVGLAWFSPDCKHFSKAKGGKPVDRHIRGLAWIVLRWAGTVRPRVIILENVEEFQTWGPVRRGSPIKSRRGETFSRFTEQLRELGYELSWRELVAANYGVPTTRKRFFMIARCDGRPIAWPEPTHAPRSSEGVRLGKLLPWRSAAEIIDWTRPCPSVFDTREEIHAEYGLSAVRPLSRNTMRRIIRGVDKFVLHGEPYVVGSQAPALIQYHTERGERVRGQSVTEPLMTIDASNRYGLAAAWLCKYYGNDRQGQDICSPLHTVTARDREALTLAHLIKYKGSNLGSSLFEPVQTITAGGEHFGVVTTLVAKAESSAELGHWPEIRELLNTYCGYNLGTDDVILFEIDGATYFLVDIGLRMLTPRELYSANGFPKDYQIDRDYTGRVYPRSKQVARCGNAVPPPFATALVKANLPEWCGEEVNTMADLLRIEAV